MKDVITEPSDHQTAQAGSSGSGALRLVRHQLEYTMGMLDVARLAARGDGSPPDDLQAQNIT